MNNVLLTMISLLPVLLFYYQQIAMGNTSPMIIRDFINVEAIMIGVDPQIAQGIVNKESQFNCNQVGDHGHSYGCWQIFLPAHADVTPAQAKDPIFSTEWSLQEIKKNGCKIWSTCADTMKELSVRDD